MKKFCFFKEGCGGCRSNYNCCSFALSAPDGIYPNVKCTTNRNLDGCYDCELLISCEIGMVEKMNL